MNTQNHPPSSYYGIALCYGGALLLLVIALIYEGKVGWMLAEHPWKMGVVVVWGLFAVIYGITKGNAVRRESNTGIQHPVESRRLD